MTINRLMDTQAVLLYSGIYNRHGDITESYGYNMGNITVFKRY